MNEPAITAEDLTLYALQALDITSAARVDLLLRSSSEARSELSHIRGDLATLALSASQHTPPALSRQRLLKQVARERRAVPISVAMQEEAHFVLDGPSATEPVIPGNLTHRTDRGSTDERRSRVRLPRIVAEPEPMFTAEETAAHDKAHRGQRPPTVASNRGSMDPQAGRRTFADLTQAYEDQAGTPGTPGMGASSPRTSPSEHPVLPANLIASSEVAANDLQPPARSVEKKPAIDVFQASAASDSALLDEASGIQDRYQPSSSLAFSGYGVETPRSRSAVILAWTGWLAAAGLAASTVFAVRSNVALHTQLNAQQVALAETQARTARADLVLQTLESAASQRFVLARQDTAPLPSARVAYLPEDGSLIFQGTNLDPLPAEKTYELWLIRSGEGTPPIAAGTFKPDAHGYATLVLPSLPKGMVAGNFGVTVEDETGSLTPTLPILLIGQQS